MSGSETNGLSPLEQHDKAVAEAVAWAEQNSTLIHKFIPPEACREIGFVPDNQKAFMRLSNQFLPAIEEDAFGGLAKYLGRIYSKRKLEQNVEAASKVVRRITSEEIIKPLKIATRDESHLAILVNELEEGGKRAIDWHDGDEPVRATALRNYFNSTIHFMKQESSEEQPGFDEFINEASDEQVLILAKDSLENATRKKKTYHDVAVSASRNPAVLSLFNSEFGREVVDEWH